ncbi:MAG: DUF885 family protein [candidate division Zixibacteria bacterium]|nr:DUF885 family protein [candidate division Zixibacteria bacterium]
MTQTFGELVDEIINFRWRSSPVEASFEGIHDYDHLLDHYDPQTRKEYFAKISEYLQKLEHFDESALENSELLDKEILTKAFHVEIKLEDEYKRLDRDATIYPEICLYGTYIILLRNYAPFDERIKSVPHRLREIPRVLNEGMENLRNGNDIPEVWTRIAIEVTEDGIQFFNFVMPQAAARAGELSDEILKANQDVIEALKKYLAFLKDELLAKSDGKFAFGKELFEFILQNQHILPYSVDDLIKIGIDTIEATQKEMDELVAEIDSDNDWREIVKELKEDHPTAEELIDYYRSEMERARDFVKEKDLVTIPEDELLSLMETPVFERTTIPYAAYMPPAPFEDRQEGFFWVTPVNPDMPAEMQKDQLQGHNRWGVVLTALHEAYPGHHLQLLHSNRVDSKVRRVFGTPVFAEGWALYCEDLMYEQGFYGNPRTRLMQLKDKLWRACRVVIDAKLHTEQMSFDEAVDMLVNVANLERTNAIAEVKRYTQSPTQPMSYIMGKLEILKLRDEYRKSKGEEFDLKEFHNKLLSFGTIPVELVRRRMLS